MPTAKSSSATDSENADKKRADADANRTILRTVGSWALTFALAIAVIMVMGGGPLQQGQRIGFTAQRLDGSVVRSQELQGKPVLLYFWATWCTACKLTTATVEGFAARHPEIEVLALTAESPQVVRAWAKDRDEALPLVANAGPVLQSLGIRAFPTTVMLNPDGTVAWNRQGVLLPGELDVRL